MKKRILLFSFCFYAILLHAQHVEWVKRRKMPERTFPKQVITDKENNVYELEISWGANFSAWVLDREPEQQHDTVGTTLNKYSKEGNFIFSKNWKNAFYIQKLIYDGNDHFYFAGYFAGSQIIDGISISNDNKFSGMFGKMRLDGEIEMIKTINSNSNSQLFDICFNEQKSSFYITGSVKEELITNGHGLGSYPERSVFVGEFNLDGEPIKYRGYNFLPDTIEYNYNNTGREIIYHRGIIYLLYDREGKHWYEDPPQDMPQSGRYLGKLDENLELLWSERKHGPDAYYGWSCHSLKSSSDQELFFLSSTGYKYGRSGAIIKAGKIDGKNIKGHGTSCGRYADVCIDKEENIFLIGQENCEPYGPGSHEGYNVIKKLNRELEILGETRVYGAGLINITIDNEGDIYVTGTIINQKAIIGGQVVYRSDNPYFIIKVSDIKCTPPEVIVSSGYDIYYYRYLFCESSTLTASPGFETYEWSSGETSSSINTTSGGNYFVKVTESSGCNSISDSKYLEKVPEPEDFSLSNLSIVNNKYRLTWYRTQHNSYYKIYKETGPEVFELLDTLHYKGMYQIDYDDRLSVPDEKAESYFVTVVDSCGRETPPSNIFRAMHLSYKRKDENIQLNWNHYQAAMPYYQYYIMAGNTPYNLSLIDSVDITINFYEYQGSVNYSYFRVDAIYSQLYPYWQQFNSNTVYINKSSSTSVSESVLPSVKMYPNPTNDIINLHISGNAKLHIQLKNMLGQVLFDKTSDAETVQISLKEFNPGIYFILASDGNESKVFKVVRN
jgi:hypothetical protein